jgi:hypothetical protein
MCVVVVRAWWSCVRACVRAYGAPAPNPPVMHPCIFLPTSHMSLVSRPTSHARHTHAHVQLCKAIPRGRVATYGGMAAALASSARAVGQVRLCVSCVCVCVCVCVCHVCVSCVCVCCGVRGMPQGGTAITPRRCAAAQPCLLHSCRATESHALTRIPSHHTLVTLVTRIPPPPHTHARARTRHALVTRSSHAPHTRASAGDAPQPVCAGRAVPPRGGSRPAAGRLQRLVGECEVFSE